MWPRRLLSLAAGLGGALAVVLLLVATREPHVRHVVFLAIVTGFALAAFVWSVTRSLH